LPAETDILRRITGNPASCQPIVFYDGECAFCNGMVQFLARHNPAGNLSFAPLQSATNRDMNQNVCIKHRSGDTIILLENNKMYEYSEAVLNIASHLSYPWKALVVFRFIPKGIRDFIYNIIARNRYRLWKRSGACPMDLRGTQHHFPG
jgi:predicted DCC family thiol-disulfide oxidoreductase YuxK